METTGEKERLDEYACGFCLNVFEAPASNYPDACPHCKVKICLHCNTFLPAAKLPTWCYGCGTINPELWVRMNRTSNFSCMYMKEEWRRAHLGRTDGPYYISTECSTGKKRLSKRGPDGKMLDVRDLTPEELEFLKVTECQE